MKKQHIFLIFISAYLFFGCKKVSSPKNENEHEAITTVHLTFEHIGQEVSVFTFDDPDGDGGNPPVTLDTIALEANKTYNVAVTLLNKTKTPTSELNAAIIKQGSAHEFFYLPNGVDITILKIDTDQFGLPLGFITTWQTQSTKGVGQVRIKLMHKPFVKGPNDGPNLGHSDVDFSFPVVIN